MDTLLYYSADLRKHGLAQDQAAGAVRPAGPGDRDPLRRIAAASFGGYVGHYHADPRLDRAKCDQAYVDWTERSCDSSDFRDVVLVADLPGPVGFCVLRRESPEEFDIRLLAVAPSAQQRGVSRSLLGAAQRWSLQHGAERLTISTQLVNLASQRAFVRAGFAPIRAYYTLHKWFDE
jgi:GNAT superfamily N-acetyltransferase